MGQKGYPGKRHAHIPRSFCRYWGSINAPTKNQQATHNALKNTRMLQFGFFPHSASNSKFSIGQPTRNIPVVWAHSSFASGFLRWARSGPSIHQEAAEAYQASLEAQKQRQAPAASSHQVRVRVEHAKAVRKSQELGRVQHSAFGIIVRFEQISGTWRADKEATRLIRTCVFRAGHFCRFVDPFLPEEARSPPSVVFWFGHSFSKAETSTACVHGTPPNCSNC